MNHLVRVGLLGHVGRFRSSEGLLHPRGAAVVVRTARGLELGEVLAHDEAPAAGDADGELLRRVTEADGLLAERLERNRDRAFRACQRKLEEHGSKAVLLDVEHLFDGRGLYFYYLGEIDEATAEISAELAAAYDAEARFGDFARTLQEGCGPGCGDAASGGCGTAGGCGSCAVAGACGTPRRVVASGGAG